MNPEHPKERSMLLARMAEAVYWAGRYLERSECTARIVQVHTDTHVDMPVGEDVGWEPLLAIAGVDGQFAEHYPDASDGGYPLDATGSVTGREVGAALPALSKRTSSNTSSTAPTIRRPSSPR